MTNYMVLIDGMTDELLSERSLLYANYPTMKEISQVSDYGWFETCPKGFVAESMTCIMTLLGLEPEFLPQGRGYLEAVAGNIPVGNDDLILRCNLAALENDVVVSSSAPGLTPEDMILAATSMQSISEDLGLQFFHMQGYKNLLLLPKGKIQELLPQAKAPHENLNQPYKYFLPQGGVLGEKLARFLEQSKEKLRKLFPNKEYSYVMIPWGISYYQPSPKFGELFPARGAVVCGTEIVKGIAKVMGLDILPVTGATADVDTDLMAKAQVALEQGKSYDFVLVHVNGADEAGHRQEQQQKLDFVKRVDKELLTKLVAKLEHGENLLVCSDHGTSFVTGKHDGSPQPFILYHKGQNQNRDWKILKGNRAVSLLLGNSEIR